MRVVESYIMYTAIYLALGQVYFAGAAACLLGVLLLWHFAGEFPRIQFAAVYCVCAMLIYQNLFQPPSESPAWLAYLAWTTLLQLVLWGSAALACLMPVAKPCHPSGSFRTLGTTSVEFKFETPTPGATASAGEGVRGMVVYPSGKGEAPPSSLRLVPWAVAKEYASFAGLPALAFHHISLAFTHACEDASPASHEPEGGCPVVVFSHGLGGTHHCYRSVVEEWASHGYVVVCVTHNDESAALATALDGAAMPYVPLTALENAERAAQVQRRQRQLRQRVSELTAVLEALKTHSGNGVKWPLLDLSRVVLAGHSFGAATALSTAAALPADAVKAVVMHDLWHLPLPQGLDGGVEVACPVLHLASDKWRQYDDLTSKVMEKCRSSSSTSLALRDIGHQNFSDLPLFCAVLARKMGNIGALPPREGLQAINALDVAFADQHTKLDAGEGAFEAALSNKLVVDLADV